MSAAADFTVPYLCTLTTGCLHPSGGHSLSCKESNQTYAEAVIRKERQRRLAVMAAALNPRVIE